MRILLGLAGAAAIATGAALTTAGVSSRHPHRGAVSYDVECFGLRSLGRDINAEASQGWTVKAMADHTSPEGQECILVLFERSTS